MSIGAQLRASRETRGLTVDAVARATRVQPRILAAIERDDVAAVPPRPFGRGFVKAYAVEMGLDGDQVTRDYFAQFAPPTPVPDELATPPAHVDSAIRAHPWIYAVGLVGITVGVALAFFARAPLGDPGAQPRPAAGTTGTESAGAAPAPERATTAPVAAAAPITLVLTAQRPAWVTATADGRREIYRILTPGPPTFLSGSREVTIRVGDAGAILWRVNGRDAGPMGRSGQVRDVRITPDNVTLIR
jgi:cytoskeleton protein RodZ